MFCQHTVWPWVMVALPGEKARLSVALIVAAAPVPLHGPATVVELLHAAAARTATPIARVGRMRASADQIGPGGLEPPFPDPKSGVLPLDEGPAIMSRLNLATPPAGRQAAVFDVVCHPMESLLATGVSIGLLYRALLVDESGEEIWSSAPRHHP